MCWSYVVKSYARYSFLREPRPITLFFTFFMIYATSMALNMPRILIYLIVEYTSHYNVRLDARKMFVATHSNSLKKT